MRRNWKKRSLSLAMAAAMAASVAWSPAVYALDGAVPATPETAQTDPAEPAPTAEEPTGSTGQDTTDGTAAQAEDLSWVDPTALANGWYDGFEETRTTTHADTAKYWKDGIIPVAFDNGSIWPTTVSEGIVFAVEQEDGNNVVHVSSTNAAGRADFYRVFENLDYTKDYLLRVRVKTENLTMKAAFLKAQVGAKINVLLNSTTFEGTNDWYTFDLPLEDLETVGALASGDLKVELYADQMTGDIWVDELQLIPVEEEEDPGVQPSEDWVDENAVWYADLSKTTATTNAYWKDGVLPSDLPSVWASPAAKNPGDTFWFEVTTVDGCQVIHCHSEDKTGRLDISNNNVPYVFDYDKNYIIKALVKTEDVVGTGFYLRGQVGKSVNMNPGDGYKITGTNGWTEYVWQLKDLAAVAGDDSGKMKLETFFEYFTGDIYVGQIQIIEDYKLSISETEVLSEPGKTFTLAVTADSDKVDLSQLAWASSNEKVATVDNGLVTVLAGGTAVITAQMDESHSVSCTLTVDDPAMEDMYDEMRERWVLRMTGNDCTDKTDTDYLTAMQGYTDAANEAWESMIKKPDGTDTRTTL